MTELLPAVSSRAPATMASLALLEEVDDALVCTAVEDITHDVRSFTFAMPGGRGLAFAPGQYLTLTVPIDGVEHERCYTIASSADCPTEVTITVKRVPDGPVSAWLHTALRPGDTVRASGPYGVFSTVHHPSPRVLFLSAGSGITPSASMWRTMAARGDAVRATVVHCARTPADIVFRSELQALANAGALDLTIVCEDDAEGEAWAGPRGRISAATLLRAVPGLLDVEVFTCGPAPFMAAVREILTVLGVDPARCHEESFVLAAEPPVSVVDPVSATATHRVEFRRSGRVIECPLGTSILRAASGAGIPLPSSCGEGVCGTCKQDLLEGEVDMQHAGGIRPREIAGGKVLLCCSTPCTDLVIDA